MNEVTRLLTNARRNLARPGGFTQGHVYKDGAFCSVGSIANETRGYAAAFNDASFDSMDLNEQRAFKLLKVCLERTVPAGVVERNFATLKYTDEEGPADPLLQAIAKLNDLSNKKLVLKAFTKAINYAKRRHYNAD